MIDSVPRDLWLFALSLATMATGWFLRTLWEAQQKFANDLAKLELKLAEDYVPNPRLVELTDAIFAKLERIEDKLDRKLDKQ
jgi:hypothetical protein